MKAYTPPSVEEIRDFLGRNDLSQTDAAQLVRVDPRTFRRYVAQSTPAAMPYSVWFTLKTKQRLRLIDAEKRGHLLPIE